MIIKQEQLKLIWRFQEALLPTFCALKNQFPRLREQLPEGVRSARLEPEEAKIPCDFVWRIFVLDILTGECESQLEIGESIEVGPFNLVTGCCLAPLVVEEMCLDGKAIKASRTTIDDYGLDLLVQAHSLVIGIKNSSGCLEWLSEPFAKLANQPRAALIEKRSRDIWTDQYGREISANDLAVVQTREIIICEEIITTQPTIRRQISLRFPFRMFENKVIRIAVIALPFDDLKCFPEVGLA